MEISRNEGKKADRQCWECLKRRLVCDHSLPHCNKCQKVGKECPGYGEQKPLQWVQTGKVTSRQKKTTVAPLIYTIPVRKGGAAARTTEIPADPTSPLPAVKVHVADSTSAQSGNNSASAKLVHSQLAPTGRISGSRLNWNFMDEVEDGTLCRTLAVSQSIIADNVDRIFQIGGQAKIEEIVAFGRHEEAAAMLRTKDQPLKKLEDLLVFMHDQDLPRYDFLSDETSEVVQAVQYYNGRIHPNVMGSGQLAPNPAIVLFPLHALHILSPTIHHTMVCMSLNHFIHTLPSRIDKQVILSHKSKIYQHRGAAIRYLSRAIAQDKTRCSDMTIASIMMFMSVELQNPVFTKWRAHAHGTQKIIELRGGIKALLQESPYLAPTLVIYVLIIITSNACSPSREQIELSSSLEQTLVDITTLYSLIFPYTLCPPALFLEVPRINKLRRRVSASLTACDIDLNDTLEAHDILSRIEAFVPEDWSQPGTFYDEWLLVGTMYQTAIAIYCIMSLQSLTLLPSSLVMNAMRSAHGDRLVSCLRKAMKLPRLVKFVAWPLVVVGIEAGYKGEATRNWVEASLIDLSRLHGTSSPLKARAVLKRYWQKEERGWEECFDRPETVLVACGMC